MATINLVHLITKVLLQKGKKKKNNLDMQNKAFKNGRYKMRSRSKYEICLLMQ